MLQDFKLFRLYKDSNCFWFNWWIKKIARDAQFMDHVPLIVDASHWKVLISPFSEMHYSTVLMLNKTYKNLFWQFHFIKVILLQGARKKVPQFQSCIFLKWNTNSIDTQFGIFYRYVVRKSPSKVPFYSLLSLCSHLFSSQVHLRYHNLDFTWNRVLKIKNNSLSDKNSRTIKDY